MRTLPYFIALILGCGLGPATTEPAADPGTKELGVRFEGDPLPDAVELACGANFRERMSLIQGAMIFEVPADASDCALTPKGGVVASKALVTPGTNVTCRIFGTTTMCK